MPEKESNLKHLKYDKLPLIIFWDTSLLAHAIFGHERSTIKKSAIEFIDKLVKEKINIAFSSILFDEFIRIACRKELIRSKFTKTQARKALQKKDPVIIKPHINDIKKDVTALYDILSKFEGRSTVIYPIDPDLVATALELQCQYKLEWADSFHIATVLFGNQKDIVAFDKDFHNVKDLYIWCKC